MLDLNIDYLQSTQVCVSYNTVVYSEKSHLENSQIRASKGKKGSRYETSLNSKCQSKRCTDPK